jgi:hypothetical protein
VLLDDDLAAFTLRHELHQTYDDAALCLVVMSWCFTENREYTYMQKTRLNVNKDAHYITHASCIHYCVAFIMLRVIFLLLYIYTHTVLGKNILYLKYI